MRARVKRGQYKVTFVHGERTAVNDGAVDSSICCITAVLPSIKIHSYPVAAVTAGRNWSSHTSMTTHQSKDDRNASKRHIRRNWVLAVLIDFFNRASCTGVTGGEKRTSNVEGKERMKLNKLVSMKG